MRRHHRHCRGLPGLPSVAFAAIATVLLLLLLSVLRLGSRFSVGRFSFRFKFEVSNLLVVARETRRDARSEFLIRIYFQFQILNYCLASRVTSQALTI